MEDSIEHFAWESDRIDVCQQFAWVEFEHGCGFGLIDFEAVSHDGFVGVVRAALLAASFEDSLDQRFVIVPAEVEYELHVDIAVDHSALSGVPGYAVKQEDLAIGVEGSVIDPFGKLFAPQRDGEVVGDEVAAGGAFGDELSVGRIGIEAAEDFATGEVEEPGESSENGTLGSFTTSGCAEEQDGSRWWLSHRVGPVVWPR